MSRFCGVCGTECSMAEQRFCSGCGAALPVETPAVDPGGHAAAMGPSLPQPQPGWATTDYAVPQQLPPAYQSPNVPVGRIMAIGALVIAMGAAGLVGWQVFGPKGGAESPEAAVEGFITAVVEQDGVGALKSVNPGEVEGLDDLYASVYDRLEEEGLTGGSRITDALDVSVDNLQFDVDDLGESAARVTLVSGDYKVTFDPDKLPERLAFIAEEQEAGEWTGDLVDDIGYEFPDADYRNDRPDPFLSTVKVDGRWYVTAFGTMVDAFVAEEFGGEYDYYGAREPDFDAIDDAPEPIVADDPEKVLENLAEAISDEDAEALLANLPADQFNVLRPYVKPLEDAFASQGISFDVAVSDVDTDVDEGGDLVRMTVDNVVIDAAGVDDGYESSGQLAVDGRCVTATEYYYDDYYEEYSDNSDQVCIDGEVADKTGIDSIFLMLREIDGGYQIDPLATAIAYAQTVVDSAPSTLIEDAVHEICYNVTYEEDLCE